MEYSQGIVNGLLFRKLLVVPVASHAGDFKGFRISSLGRDEIRAPLKTPAWEASSPVVLCIFKCSFRPKLKQKLEDTPIALEFSK